MNESPGLDTQTLIVLISVSGIFVSATGVLTTLAIYLHGSMKKALDRLHDRLDKTAEKVHVEKHEERIRDIEIHLGRRVEQ